MHANPQATVVTASGGPARWRLRGAGIMAALVLSLGACGGDDTPTIPDAEPVDEAVVEPTGDAPVRENGTDDATSAAGDARATVVIDGVTYQFLALPTPDDYEFYSYCTPVAGSLQGGMQLVDDAGNRIEGGELDFVLLEPGSLYEQEGGPAELTIALPGDNGIGYIADDIDAPASGRTASGTFTASNGIGGTISGTIDASC